MEENESKQPTKKKPNKKRKKFNDNKEISDKIELCSQDAEASQIEVNSFSDFPISSRTQQGLEKAGFSKPTDIQQDGISLALRGFDVLAAARTGSGKTLAFLIPVIELLWREKWTNENGLGALIISPTRELAYQTFEVLRKVGACHDLSAGLIIGGKDMLEEQKRISQTNIIICTPGRLLQHFDETPNFQCSELQILVLDEADRILDLGFSQAMNAIIENLPDTDGRQTLLYSATQTKSVQDLARLSLKEPKYISVHENDKYSTPKKLMQTYCVVELQDKMNFLFSFIKNHLKTKAIVFMSSCKQVKFVYETFRKLRPGVPLLALYGKQKQLKRVGVYERFVNTPNAVLFATDIAARGLDFPAVNWVVQLDCPEDANTYIHRAGRTARYQKGGQALLLLLPSEIAILKNLEEKKIPIHEIKVNPKKLRPIQGKLQAFCAQSQDIKLWAQKSVVSYTRSIYLQSNKEIFDVHQLPVEQYANSLGLLLPPRIRFMKKLQKKIGPSEARKAAASDKQKLGIEMLAERMAGDNSDDDDSSDPEREIIPDQETKSKKKKADTVKDVGEDVGEDVDDDDSSDDDLLVTKHGQQQHELINDDDDQPLPIASRQKIQSKATTARKLLHKNIKMNTKIRFDDEGQASGDVHSAADSEEANANLQPVSLEEAHRAGGIDIGSTQMEMRAQDLEDRNRERSKVKKKHREARKKEREVRKAAAVGESSSVTCLGPASDEDEGEDHGIDNLLAMVSSAEEDVEEDENNEEERSPSPLRKKRRRGTEISRENTSHTDRTAGFSQDEELALHLLGAG